MSEIKSHYRTCNICEAMCGIEIQYQGQKILSIKGDKKDPISRGHICPKAVALQDFYYDKDRLRKPIRKTPTGWEEMSWDEALDYVEKNIKTIQEKYGDNAFGSYIGNPNAHNLGSALFLPKFFKSLKTKNRYSSASADQLPHHVASNFMFGHGMLIPIPDIDRTDFLLIIGGNPLVSNGSMMTAPDFAKRMKAIQKRGGKVVVIDPRKTETAQKADQHFFIKPETDALLLLSMIHTIFEAGEANLRHLDSITEGLDIVEEFAKDYSPEKVAPIIGIEAKQIKSLAQEFANAPTAICYSRMGASTQSFGGLCQWLTNVLNIISGNFDREGGAMFTLPAFDQVSITSKKNRPDSYGRYKSRVSSLPYFNGEFPVSVLAEEINTPGEGKIKGMITIAGNPVLSSPNGKQLETAFQQLEFMVSIDIYLNETTRHADIILPVATGLEASHYDIFFNVFSIRNTAKYSPPLFERAADQRYDWEVLKALAARLSNTPEDNLTPELMLDMALRGGLYGKEGMSLEKLKANPHGIDLGELRPCLEKRLQTKDDLIHLAPAFFTNDLTRLNEHFFNSEDDQEKPFLLIGRRVLRSHNTWTHNAHRLVKGKNQCTLLLNPENAKQLGIASGQIVQVASATGSVEIEAEVSDEMMPGVVSIPQGWGSREETNMTIAAQHPGVSINDITDSSRVDLLTGNAAFSGVPVDIIVA
jgi:anaerobic selenocysteine-containing dehydrogenase